MEYEDVVRSMRGRMPWSVAQKALRAAGLTAGQGWEKTQDRLLEDSDDIEDTTEILSDILREHILCGEKTVRFYNLKKAHLQSLRDALLGAVISDTDFSKAYPGTLEVDDLESLDFPEPQLVAVEQVGKAVAGIFASVRVFERREIRKIKDMPPAVRSQFAGYKEIVLVSREPVQAMDVVWLPAQGSIVETRIDALGSSRLEDTYFAHQKIKSLLDALSGSILPEPSNLFPLIEQMYQAPGEGIVTELTFTTNTKSLKQERMRGDRCLRKELFHVGGKKAVNGQIDPFRLSIEWIIPLANEIKGKAELSLHSSARASAAAQPSLTEAIISNCAGRKAYDHVVSRIEAYL